MLVSMSAWVPVTWSIPFRFGMRTGNASDAQPNERGAPINDKDPFSTVDWVK